MVELKQKDIDMLKWICAMGVMCVVFGFIIYSSDPGIYSQKIGNLTQGLVRLPYDKVAYAESVNQETCDRIWSNGAPCVKYNIDDLDGCVDEGWHRDTFLGNSYHNYVCKDIGRVRKTCVEWGQRSFPDYC